jgi:D-amino-acid dehydrogenase
MAANPQRVVIIGAGVIGSTTAYYLALAGCEVVVIDHQPGPALETSFANAGQISPGYASPWASPDVPKKIPAWLLMEHAPLILQPKLDAAMIGWLLGMLRNCTAARYAQNKARMGRLAEYSRQQLIALREETGIEYDGRARGTLQLFRKQSQLDAVGKDTEVVRKDGVPFEVLDRQECIAVEPGLAFSTDAIAGGLRLPNDETCDCFKFTTELAARAEALGVGFEYGAKVSGLVREGARIAGVATDRGIIQGDSYVVAAGAFSPALVGPLGIRLPVYPVKGYSVTLPIVHAERAPQSTLLDESYKIAITRLGDRIRVGGMAEISGYKLGIKPSRQRTLDYSLKSLFPDVGDLAAGQYWAGLRPMTPDGTPVIGPTPIANLFLNTGHGTLGWTMACGSGRIVADAIAGRAADIDTEGLGLERYA